MTQPTVVQTKIAEDRFMVIRKITISGGDEDLTKTIIADISTMTEDETKPYIEIYKIEYDLNGFDVNLYYDATSDEHIVFIPRGKGVLDADGSHEGKFRNHNFSGVTGDILLDTVGIDNSDQNGEIILYMNKTSTIYA